MNEPIIAMLEDDERRAERLLMRLRENFPYAIRWFNGLTCEMTEWLDVHLSETILICLDHDLNLLTDRHGSSIDPGCGRDVSDFLLQKPATCPVVIHSTNVVAATAMQESLKSHGWVVSRTTPYGDLDWVDEAWLPIIRSLLARR